MHFRAGSYVGGRSAHRVALAGPKPHCEPWGYASAIFAANLPPAQRHCQRAGRVVPAEGARHRLPGFGWHERPGTAGSRRATGRDDSGVQTRLRHAMQSLLLLLLPPRDGVKQLRCSKPVSKFERARYATLPHGTHDVAAARRGAGSDGRQPCIRPATEYIICVAAAACQLRQACEKRGRELTIVRPAQPADAAAPSPPKLRPEGVATDGHRQGGPERAVLSRQPLRARRRTAAPPKPSTVWGQDGYNGTEGGWRFRR